MTDSTGKTDKNLSWNIKNFSREKQLEYGYNFLSSEESNIINSDINHLYQLRTILEYAHMVLMNLKECILFLSNKEHFLVSDKAPFHFAEINRHINNVKLYAHPNPNKQGSKDNPNNEYYVIPKNYIDNISSFSSRVYEDWEFNINDKRKIKRIKKQRK